MSGRRRHALGLGGLGRDGRHRWSLGLRPCLSHGVGAARMFIIALPHFRVESETRTPLGAAAARGIAGST